MNALPDNSGENLANTSQQLAQLDGLINTWFAQRSEPNQPNTLDLIRSVQADPENQLALVEGFGGYIALAAYDSGLPNPLAAYNYACEMVAMDAVNIDPDKLDHIAAVSYGEALSDNDRVEQFLIGIARNAMYSGYLSQVADVIDLADVRENREQDGQTVVETDARTDEATELDLQLAAVVTVLAPVELAVSVVAGSEPTKQAEPVITLLPEQAEPEATNEEGDDEGETEAEEEVSVAPESSVTLTIVPEKAEIIPLDQAELAALEKAFSKQAGFRKVTEAMLSREAGGELHFSFNLCGESYTKSLDSHSFAKSDWAKKLVAALGTYNDTIRGMTSSKEQAFSPSEMQLKWLTRILGKALPEMHKPKQKQIVSAIKKLGTQDYLHKAEDGTWLLDEKSVRLMHENRLLTTQL